MQTRANTKAVNHWFLMLFIVLIFLYFIGCVLVVGTAILFQDAETFLEIRNFWIFRTCRNVRNTGTVRTHLCLANIRDTCQAQYDYHDYLFQNFNNFRLLFTIIFK